MLQLVKYNIFYPVNHVHLENHGSDNIYPNPADDHITVEYAIIDFSDGMQLTLSDMQGKIIKQIALQNQVGELRIDVTDLEKGVYILNFGNGLYSKKISIK